MNKYISNNYLSRQLDVIETEKSERTVPLHNFSRHFLLINSLRWPATPVAIEAGGLHTITADFFVEHDKMLFYRVQNCLLRLWCRATANIIPVHAQEH